MNQTQGKTKTPREHIDTIFNARNILSFVGEAIGQSSESFSESAQTGVFLIMEYLRDDLENAGSALTDALYGKPGDIKTPCTSFGCANGVEAQAHN